MSLHLNHLDPKHVSKPWGSETWHILSRDFCVKTITLLKGSKTSYQYHVKKEEVNFIKNGTAEVLLEDDEGIMNTYLMKEGDSFFVPVSRKHRVIALTDLVMWEVSNEFVDDVVRINDEFGRGDGRLESEHQTPAVLILAAGLGSRLKYLTETKNKGLIPLGNKAVISHIIECFPKEYEIVMAVGYKGVSLSEYCTLAHPDRRFTFVTVRDWDDPKTDPGHSAFQCKAHLQRPFYLATADCLIESPSIPHMDGNWIGTYPTDYPEKYATVETQGGLVTSVLQKAARGHKDAFIGIAAVLDYAAFWSQLEASPVHELVSAWANPDQYPAGLRTKTLGWYDTGNLDDLTHARAALAAPELASHKATAEVVYNIGNRVLKYSPDHTISANRFARGKVLGNLVPANLTGTCHFIAYDWVKGRNLYQHDSLELYRRFLDVLGDTIRGCDGYMWASHDLTYRFYHDKTWARLKAFKDLHGGQYLIQCYTINGIPHNSLSSILTKVDYDSLRNNPLYEAFHGDLHWDNLIYEETTQRFAYIDWRESYAGDTKGGDLYYDLAKLYAGCIVPFELLKDEGNMVLVEGSSSAVFTYEVSPNLLRFTRDYEQWIVHSGYDLRKVRLIAGLALLNIAPLHTPLWNKVLFFSAISLLDAATR